MLQSLALPAIAISPWKQGFRQAATSFVLACYGISGTVYIAMCLKKGSQTSPAGLQPKAEGVFCIHR